ncbi:MAG: GMC oxidoreductase [Solirubrobacteraceae bacterium]
MNAEETQPYVVVGAGPAGAAAASALVARGHRPIVVDVGLTLEPEREEARRRMAQGAPSRWSAADIALTGYHADAKSGAGYKQLFGSDVAFRADGALELEADAGVGARPSYTLGGLSNVWGAGVLPYTDRDLAGWPLTASDLAAGYRAAFQIMPHAAEEDELAGRYPLVSAPDGPLLRSDLGERLLERLRRNASSLRSAGFHFGASRLAVRAGHPAPAAGCVYCLHCLDGCPYGHIYSAAQTIEALRSAGLIEYRAGLHVDRVREQDGQVTVEATRLAGPRGAATGVHRAGGEEPGLRAETHDARDAERNVTLRARRVFLAAGAVSSTIILQRSGLLPERSEILDSQTLYLPFAWIGGTGRTGREPGHTLAQAFLVLEDPAVAAQPVHISLYTYNDGLSERARAAHPRIGSLLGPALDRITRRLVIGICFFHSDVSNRVASIWQAQSQSARLEPVHNHASIGAVARLKHALWRSLPRVGLIPLTPLAELAPAGGGYHYGGSLPMRADPNPGEADILGRPLSAQRIHVVDSSCFPSVPGGTVTVTAMANAHRIATAALSEDGG